MSRYQLFDREQIELRDLKDRGHDLTPAGCPSLDSPFESMNDPEFDALASAIVVARRCQRPVILMMGAHPIKLGLSRFIIDMIRQGAISHIATNGAGIIHDYELALGGGTSENVPRWIREGQFGLWQQTGRINDIIVHGANNNEGLGEAIGRTIIENEFPRSDLSIAAACWECGIPMTSHVSIGSDIIHSHPNCDGASLGKCTYTDFLIFTESVRNLEGGVYLNVGTAVTGPEVYLKALSMARNVARQRSASIADFTTAVFDLVELPANYRQGPPGKSHAMYYYRPWKTILVRTVADGGTSYYFQADHTKSIPSLWKKTAAILRNRSDSKPSAA